MTHAHWSTTWLFSRNGIGLYILIRKDLQDIVSKKCKAQENCFVWFFGLNTILDLPVIVLKAMQETVDRVYLCGKGLELGMRKRLNFVPFSGI